MIQRLRNRQGGFTLIELLIVVAIIGIIAAILIPNLLDAIQKAKQKTTLADQRTVGTAFFSYVTDLISGAAAGRTTGNDGTPWTQPAGSLTFTQLEAMLVRPGESQNYIQTLPREDGWGNAWNLAVSREGGSSGNSLNAADVQAGGAIFAIGSGGRDGTFVWPTERLDFIATDYDQDIVWSDGYYITKPGGLGTDSGSSTP